jgi:hypothetical protein
VSEMEKLLDELANFGSLMTRGQLTQPRSVGPRIVGIAEEVRALAAARPDREGLARIIDSVAFCEGLPDNVFVRGARGVALSKADRILALFGHEQP